MSARLRSDVVELIDLRNEVAAAMVKCEQDIEKLQDSPWRYDTVLRAEDLRRNLHELTRACDHLTVRIAQLKKTGRQG